MDTIFEGVGYTTACGWRILSVVARASSIDVYDYLDYRGYLRDEYEARKLGEHGFSYRAFSRRAGLRSPNHLKRVTEGERNLTPEMAARYAKALGLVPDAARYFVDLVAFNQARTGAARDAAYQRLTGSRGYRKAHRLDLVHAAYHSTWYLPAIREMVARDDFSAEPAWIASRMIPPITVAEASEALDVLFELGLLVRDRAGVVRRADAIVTTGPETRGHHIGTYHRTMLRHAAESIDRVPAAARDISALTLCVGPDGLRRLKARIQRFRQELAGLAEEEDERAQVVQLNIQLFPLTTRREDEEGSA